MKILFITGYAGQADCPYTAAPTSHALLNKPFTMATMAARVQEMLAARPAILG